MSCNESSAPSPIMGDFLRSAHNIEHILELFKILVVSIYNKYSSMIPSIAIIVMSCVTSCPTAKAYDVTKLGNISKSSKLNGDSV